jgi:hypothetical protein
MKNNVSSNSSAQKRQSGIQWVICLAIAVAMGLAASGSGNPATVDPLPDWINTGSNLMCIVIGALVLWPRTRFVGAVAAALMMVVSMATNYWVDGAAYFIKVLPFNLITLALSAIVAWHHRGQRPSR